MGLPLSLLVSMATNVATKANEILAGTELPNRAKTDGYTALEQVAEFLRTRGPSSMRESA